MLTYIDFQVIIVIWLCWLCMPFNVARMINICIYYCETTEWSIKHVLWWIMNIDTYKCKPFDVVWLYMICCENSELWFKLWIECDEYHICV